MFFLCFLYIFCDRDLLLEAKMVRFQCFQVNTRSRDDVLSLRPFRDPSSPPPHGVFSPNTPRVQFVPPIMLPVLFYVEYILMLILLSMCSFGLLVHRDFPFFATILPPSASRSPSLSRLPPPAALLPILGDLGAVLKVPHTPEAVSGPLPSHERNTQ